MSTGSTAPQIWSPRDRRARSPARLSPRIPTHPCLPALHSSQQPHWVCQVWPQGEPGRDLGSWEVGQAFSVTLKVRVPPPHNILSEAFPSF